MNSCLIFFNLIGRLFNNIHSFFGGIFLICLAGFLIIFDWFFGWIFYPPGWIFNNFDWFFGGIYIFDTFFIGLSNVMINFFLSLINFLLSLNDYIGKLSSNRLGDVLERVVDKDSLLPRHGDSDRGNIFENLESLYSNGEGDAYNADLEGIGNGSNPGDKFDENLKKDFFKEFLANRNLLNFNSLIKVAALVFSILIIAVLFVSYFVSFEIGMVILLLFALLTAAFIYLPQMKKEKQRSQFSKELPYALRQLSTELKSGKSLFDSLDSVANADYGVLSMEFSRLLREVRYGESTENAFIHLNSRVKSKGLSRASSEILSTLRVGGNLSNSLSIIAEDINFDMRMKLKEYSQKLNAFIMIYTFLAILAPVIVLTLLLAASVVMGDIVPANLILVLYGLFFPMIIVFLGFLVKKLEPKV